MIAWHQYDIAGLRCHFARSDHVTTMSSDYYPAALALTRHKECRLLLFAVCVKGACKGNLDKEAAKQRCHWQSCSTCVEPEVMCRA
jgi:hypothetical protein